MSNLVKFTEFYSNNPKQQKKALTYLVDPDHVGLVVPKKNYTTLLVQGMWLHITGLHEEVLDKLGYTQAERPWGP